MKSFGFLMVAGTLLVGVSQLHAQDTAAGESLYQSVCKNCHGPTARGMASFPRLSGNTAEYLVMRLESYRAGEKLGPNAPLMWPLAADLSDEDIANLAAYIVTKKALKKRKKEERKKKKQRKGKRNKKKKIKKEKKM